ncbi:MAG: hypothetical protein IJY29_05210 [Ruminococcus sp.]|nr:hypothetical protein [Ruminococcus sp.]
MKDGASFCTECGANIGEASTSSISTNAINNGEITKRKSPSKLIVAAIIVVVIVIIGMLGSGGDSSTAGGKSDGITIDSNSVFENELGSISNIEFDVLSFGGVNISGDFTASDYYSFDGKITDSYSYAIEFKAYDKDGKILQDGTIYTPSVSADETCSFLGNAALENGNEVDRIKFTDISLWR